MLGKCVLLTALPKKKEEVEEEREREREREREITN
jgi:hypothetical protein